MNSKTNIGKIFNVLFRVHLFLNLTNCLCNIASGYIAGNFLDNVAMACNSLISPYNLLIMAVAYVYSSASEILCGKFMGNGDKKSINKTFTNSIVLAVFTGIIFTLIALLFAPKIVTILGANSDIHDAAIMYLSAYSLGIFSYILMPLFVTYLHMENEGNYVTVSVILLGISYVIIGFLLVKVLKLGYFGFGLTTSLSQIITVIFLAIKLYINKEQMYFEKGHLDTKLMGKMLILGFPSGSSGALLSFRNIILNNILITSGGVMATAANSVMRSGLSIEDAIITSCLTTTTMLASICIGEKNKNEMIELAKYIAYKVIPFDIILILIQILCSDLIASIYSTDVEVIKLGSFALRLYFISNIFEICSDCLIAIYTIFEYNKFVNFFNLVHNFVYHIIYALIFKNIIGIYSVFTGFIFTEILSLLTIIIYSQSINKHMPMSIEDLIMIHEDFDKVKKYNKIVKDYTDVSTLSAEINEFCINNNIDKRKTYLTGLCAEEMCANIFEHGYTKKQVKNKRIDVFVLIDKDNISLRIRDNSIAFNPTTRSIIFNPEDPCKNIGIRLVSKISKEMTYQNLFGFNNMIIKL